MPGLSAEAEGLLADVAERGRAGNTLAAYRRDLTAYERFLARRGLSAIEAAEDDVAEYVASLEEAGRRPASVARALVTVRALHRWCGSDAARGVGSPDPVEADRAVLTVAEAHTLVESAAGSSASARRDQALLELLYATGARISEVVGLDVDDVAGGVAHLGGRNPRDVPYGEPAAAALDEWLAPPGRRAIVATGGGTGLGRALLLNQRGGRLSRQWGWSVVRSHGELVGLASRLGPHVLRHSFAVHLGLGGAPPAAVQQFLVGQPVVLTSEELRAGYARWHPRATFASAEAQFTQ